MGTSHYTLWARRLHWLVALAVVLALVLIETRGWFERGSALREGIKWGHMQFGIAVLLLAVPRILLRMRTPVPAISPPPPAWQDWIARLVHAVLYLLLLAVPLLGIATMSLSGKEWNFLGLPLQGLVPADKARSDSLEAWHETAGEVLMWLAIAHAVAGLAHHYVRRDDTLRRMLPAWRNPAATRVGRD
jgi:superoxide oxidase